MRIEWLRQKPDDLGPMCLERCLVWRADTWRVGLALALQFVIFAAVLSASPASAQNLGACRAGGDIDTAIAACTAVIERSGPTVSRERLGYAYHVRGILRRQRLEYPEAIDDFTRAIELNPKDVASLFNRGDVRALIGLLDQGQEDVEAALRASPRSAPAHAALGRVRLLMGRHADALAAFDEALRLNGREHGALVGRARTLNLLGRHAEARAAIEQALAVHPNDSELLRERAIADAQGREPERQVARREAPDRQPPALPVPPVARDPVGPADRTRSAGPVGSETRGPAADVTTQRPTPLPGPEPPTPPTLTSPPAGRDVARDVARIEPPPTQPQGTPPPTRQTAPPIAVPDPQAGAPSRIAEGPRQGPGAEPRAPPAPPEGARPVLARAPFYCGMVQSWREHAARYAGVRLDGLGCDPP